MAHHSERSRAYLQTRFWRYGPLLLWLALIFFASTSTFAGDNTSRFIRPLLVWLFPQMSGERIALLHVLIRKLGHFTEYAVLGFLAARAFAGSSRRVLRENWIIASAILVVVYSLLDEFHQSFVTSRTASIFDCLIDMAGGFFALLCLRYFRRQPTNLHYPTQAF